MSKASRLERESAAAVAERTFAKGAHTEAVAEHGEAVARDKAARADVKAAELAQTKTAKAAAKVPPETLELGEALGRLARWADAIGDRKRWITDQRRGALGPDGLKKELAEHVAEIERGAALWAHQLATERVGSANANATATGREVEERAATVEEAATRLQVAKQDEADAAAVMSMARKHVATNGDSLKTNDPPKG
ncbi:MAG: hypothetical protein OXH49_11330 [Gemmatimonadetes bacterium]|nr:hypothetical protein [Gemmatimonadota bacterium]